MHQHILTASDHAGEPKLAKKVVCMHEEDHGLLWKHVEYRDGRSDSRRSRRLNLNFIATIANYEYQFATFFYQVSHCMALYQVVDWEFSSLSLRTAPASQPLQVSHSPGPAPSSVSINQHRISLTILSTFVSPQP